MQFLFLSARNNFLYSTERSKVQAFAVPQITVSELRPGSYGARVPRNMILTTLPFPSPLSDVGGTVTTRDSPMDALLLVTYQACNCIQLSRCGVPFNFFESFATKFSIAKTNAGS